MPFASNMLGAVTMALALAGGDASTRPYHVIFPPLPTCMHACTQPVPARMAPVCCCADSTILEFSVHWHACMSALVPEHALQYKLQHLVGCCVPRCCVRSCPARLKGQAPPH